MARFKAAKSLWLDILQKGKLSVFAACSSSDPSPEDEFIALLVRLINHSRIRPNMREGDFKNLTSLTDDNIGTLSSKALNYPVKTGLLSC